MNRTLSAIRGAIIVLSLFPPVAQTQQTNRPSSPIIAIKAGRLLDVKTGVATENQTILIENGRIKSVGSPGTIPDGVKVIDLSRSTTINAAELLGWQNRVGSIEAGRYADIIAVGGDPLKDISELGKIKSVMKDGVVI